MTVRAPVTADDVQLVVDGVVEVLRPGVNLDWSVPAGTLEWNCRSTGEHLAGTHLVYAAQLAIQKRETRYTRLYARPYPEDTPPKDILEGIQAGGTLLAMVVRGSPPDARAYHPFGFADAEGFAAGGCIEGIVHGHDLASGLGLPYDPPHEVCARVLARMFPYLETGVDDPFIGLLAATGRPTEPGGTPPMSYQRWHSAPLTS